MASIGLLTCSEEPDLWDDDVLLYNGLISRGHYVKNLVWDDKSNDLQNYDIILFRSVWDYHSRYLEFISWINSIERLGLNIYNPLDAIKYNINKRYLLELQDDGVSIIPFVIKNKAEITSFAEYFTLFDSDEIIIKPTVGASSYRLHKVTKDKIFDKKIIDDIHTEDLIIQKYVPEVVTHGEISMVYFNNKFSHAVIKKAKAGDFRVQDDYGGTFEYFQPSKDLIEKSDAVIKCVKYDLLYARVDCLYYSNTFFLMELEIIEPILYLHNEQYLNRFLTVIDDSLSKLKAG